MQDQDPDEGCNKKIAALFGGKGAEVATRLDMLRRLGKFYGKISDRSDHLYKNGVFHIYSDEIGNPDVDTALYVPKGAKYLFGGEFKSEREWKNSFRFKLSGEYKGVTVSFVHVAGTYGGNYNAKYLGKAYRKNGRLIGEENESGTSVQIGIIGGLGGEGSKSGGYRHSHVVVRRDGSVKILK